MFGLFFKMFIGSLSFSKSLANKCISLNNEQCKTRSFLLISILLSLNIKL